jgi:hypothetical protein
MTFAFSLLLLMFLHADNRFGLGGGGRHTLSRCCTKQSGTIKLRPTLGA